MKSNSLAYLHKVNFKNYNLAIFYLIVKSCELFKVNVIKSNCDDK